MNILFISRGYPTDQDPVWGNFERDQAVALQRLGHNVTIMSIDGRFRLLRRKLGITVKYDHGFSIYSIYLFPLAFFANFYRLKRLCRDVMALLLYKRILNDGIKPDIVYAHYLRNIAACRLIKSRYNIPIVGIEHWSEINKIRIKRYVYDLGKVGYVIPDRLIAVSESLKLQIKKIWGVDSVVINNMVDDRFFLPHSKNPIKKDLIEFVSVGSLIKRKGFDLLVNAFSVVAIPRDKWKLTIVGDGPEYSYLNSLILSKDLEKNITVMGKRSRTEIKELLSRSDCFILASRAETFGVVFIEAMAVGLPCVGTICGGPEEIINKGNGLLVPNENVAKLVEAIETMFKTARTYDSDAIEKRCKEKYSSSTIAYKLDKTFRELIEDKK